MYPNDPIPRDEILSMASYWPSRVITTAAYLRLFTALSEKTMTAPALASSTGLNPRALEILLDALVGIGLMLKQDGLYSNTPEAEQFLVEERPGTIAYRLRQQHIQWKYWDRLADVIRTGEPARERRLFASDPEGSELLLRSFHEMSRERVGPMLEKIGPARRLLDLGGGSGSYSVAFCETYPEATAVVFDQPISIRVAREIHEGDPVLERIEFVTGDFRKDPLGGPYDLVLVSNIIHGEGPGTVQEILKRVFECLEPGGRVVIRDFLVSEDRTAPAHAAIFAVNMLVGTPEGRCYSEGEVRSLLLESGYEGVRTLEAGSLMEGRRPTTA
jgi:ubiquinone/menaquinone biosynthesis C-methylase UbiE